MSEPSDRPRPGGHPRRPAPTLGRVLGGVVAPLVISVVVSGMLIATVDAAWGAWVGLVVGLAAVVVIATTAVSLLRRPR